MSLRSASWLCLLAGAVALATAPAQGAQEAGPASSWKRDSRLLAASVSWKNPGATTAALLAAFSRQAGVVLKADALIAADPVICRLSNAPAVEALQGLCDVMGYTIERDPDGGGAYRLDLEERYRRIAVRAPAFFSESEEREMEEAVAAGEEGLRRALLSRAAGSANPFADAVDNQSPGLIRLLAGMPAGLQQAISFGAAQANGVIAAQNNEHLRGQLIGFGPIGGQASPLAGLVGEALRGRLSGLGLDPGSPQTMAGLFAAGGIIGIAVEINGNLEMAQTASLAPDLYGAVQSRAGRREWEVRDEIERLQAPSAEWRDPKQHPIRLQPPTPVARFPLTPTASPSRPSADLQLHTWSERSGRGVIADGWAETTVDRGARLWHGVKSSEEWAQELALSMQRLYRQRSAILLLRSRQFLWNRLNEPPADLVVAWREQSTARGRIEIPLLARASRLTTRQRQLLPRAAGEPAAHRAAVLLSRWRPLLQALSEAGAGQLDSAAQQGTHAVSETNPWQRRRLNYLRWAGQPISAQRGKERLEWKSGEREIEVRYYTAEGAGALYRLPQPPLLPAAPPARSSSRPE